MVAGPQQTSEAALASPTFLETAPTLEADDYVVYHGSDAVAVFSNRPEGVLLDQFLNFSASTLFVYAETIYLQSREITLPGKTLGLFCHELVLSLGEACIDVSGDRGDNATSPTAPGADGGDGGAVVLYVEAPTPDQRAKLRLKAFGGDGGSGADGVAGTPNGSSGGAGGDCGSITCYLGSTALRYGQRLTSITAKKTWAGWVEEASKGLADDVATLIGSGVDADAAHTWQAAVSSTASLLAATQKLQTALAGVLNGSPERVAPGKATADTARQLLDAVAQLRTSTSGPSVPSNTSEASAEFASDVAALTALAAQCDSFYGGVQKEKKLRDAMQTALKTIAGAAPLDGASPLADVLEGLLDALRLATTREPFAFAQSVCQLAGGRGGCGGSGRTAQDATGARGQDKPDNKARAQLVSLSAAGSRADCQVDQAIACPEQCQMLLDQADRLYFTCDLALYPEAVRLYTKLTQRLGFTEVLLNDKELRQKAPIAKALQDLEHRHALTTDTLAQLSRIYTTAQRRLNGIRLNQDLWGHGDVWVPRLSLAYYGNRVRTMIDNFKDLEAIFKEHAQAQQKQRLTEAQLEQAQLANGAMAQAARAQLDSLSKAGGELAQAANAIELFRPRLVAAREAVSAALAELQDAIRTQFSLSPESVIEAMSMLSMAPEGFTAVVQTADVLYKAGAKIEDAQGNLVRKDYVVHQLATCQGSLASLAATFATLQAGDLTADDPGYAKIFATADDIQKILDDFAEKVPAAAASTKQQLAAFTSVVTQRNATVLHYNSLLLYHGTLQATLRHCASEAQRLGSRALALQPSLPAIYFWLKTLKRDSLLRILQELNSQARALSFWGPMPVSSVTFAPPGPMDGSLQLRLHQETLVRLFEKAYEGFQSGGWTAWPADAQLTGEGIRVPLSPAALDSLKATSEALVTVTPRAHTDFQDMANARVTQVRVWLLGAAVAGHDPDAPQPRHPLRVEITHCGNDTVWTPDGSPCTFRHAPVTMQFSYETTLFNASEGKCSGHPDLVYGRQDIEHDYAGGPHAPGAADKPPIGPFGDWKIRVRRDVNSGLDLTGVTKAWIEFCGRNQTATETLRGMD